MNYYEVLQKTIKKLRLTSRQHKFQSLIFTQPSFSLNRNCFDELQVFSA